MNTILKKPSHYISFIIKTILVFCALSSAFSLVGLLLPEKGPLSNPVGDLTIHEIAGHFVWGLVFGAVTLSLRYTILAGFFAVLIDSDHLIGLTHLDALGRMSHSISFGIIACMVLMVSFGKKDWKLGAIAFSAVLSHVSFDIFDGDPKFPIFAPFYNHPISFTHIDWLYFEIAAIIIVGIVTVLAKKTSKNPKT
jgi:hypothetical protein